MSHCDARVLLWTGGYDSEGIPGVAECGRPADHYGSHTGPLTRTVNIALGGTNRPEITWADDDRRTFRGNLEMCSPDCVLPEVHRGDHAA